MKKLDPGPEEMLPQASNEMVARGPVKIGPRAVTNWWPLPPRERWPHFLTYGSPRARKNSFPGSQKKGFSWAPDNMVAQGSEDMVAPAHREKDGPRGRGNGGHNAAKPCATSQPRKQ